MNMKKALVVTGLPPPGLEIIRARDDVELEILDRVDGGEFARAIADADGVTLLGTPLTAELIAAAKSLKVVCRWGVGYDRVDVAALTARGIPLAVTGAANSDSVAEQAFFLMLGLAKQGPAYDRGVRAGRFRIRSEAPAFDLFGKTLLVVGFGRIGRRTATRAKAFGMRVLVCDPYIPAEEITAEGHLHVDDYRAALAQADFVTIHTPKTEETVGMFGAAELAAMKPTAYLVNTARGGIVDETALYEALKGGGIAGAGLDVFDPEPPAADNPLLKLDNVILSPHSAGVSTEAARRMSERTARNLLDGMDGALDRAYVVNPEVLDR